jgi:hypothetical protein
MPHPPLPYLTELTESLIAESDTAERVAFNCSRRSIDFYVKKGKLDREDITDYFSHRYRFGTITNTNHFGTLTGLQWFPYHKNKLGFLEPLDKKDRRIDYLKWKLYRKQCPKIVKKEIHFRHLTANNKPHILTKGEMTTMLQFHHRIYIQPSEITAEAFIKALKKA